MMRGGKTSTQGRRDPEDRQVRDWRSEPIGLLARRIGRVVLWAALLLVLVRGVGAIFSGDPESASRAQAGAGSTAAQAFPDDEARAYAVQFTRAYLTFTPKHPEYQQAAVEPFLAAQLRQSGALELPESGPNQTVTGATVARARALGRDRALVTVAATVVNRTVTTRYLTVPVARDNTGGLIVYDYPAFSSPPAAGAVRVDDPTALEGAGTREIPDLLRRFLAAYLDGRQLDDLSYFLARDARVTPLGQTYRLRDVLGVAQVGKAIGRTRTVLVTVRARDPETRADYTLRYRAEVVRRDRWYVQRLEGGAT